MKLTIEHLKGYLGTGLIGINQIGKLCEFTLSDGRYLLDRDFKPLLYPLSSLTEYREDLGFVPWDCLSYGFEVGSVNFMMFKDVNKLLSWHIDIHNLIENNLAIDKRTIKN